MQAEPERSRHDQEPAFPIPDRIPVFPLPDVVFFPGTYLPLHIFEPRYRKMVEDTVASSHCIGMALLKEGWEEDYYGNPPVFDVGCVGRVVSVQSLPGGRYNILLHGLRRYEIKDQSFDQPYRQATMALKPAEDVTPLEASTRAELLEIVGAYAHTREDGHGWQELVRLDLPDEILVNNLCSGLECTPLEKQFLLEADSLRQRARRLSDIIQFMLHEQGGAKGLG